MGGRSMEAGLNWRGAFRFLFVTYYNCLGMTKSQLHKPSRGLHGYAADSFVVLTDNMCLMTPSG